MIAIQNGGDIDIDDVTISQDLLGIGDAVAHHLINAGTNRFGKWIGALATGISQRSTFSTVGLRPTFCLIVELQGTNTGFNHWLQVIQQTGSQLACPTHLFDFPF